MNKRIVDILEGIADGIFPNVSKSIKHTAKGREVNGLRLTVAVLSWLTAIGLIKGVVSFAQIIELVKIITRIE
jgi:hypothetical protein